MVKNMDCREVLKEIRDNSLDLIIADPPYFRVLKSEKWDNFKSFDEYLGFSMDYLTLCIQKLRLSGVLLLYGCAVSVNIMCGLNDIILKNGCYFVQEIIIDKGIKSVAGRISKKIKMLPPVTENIFIYRKDAKPFIKNLLQHKQQEYNYSSKHIKEKLGMPLNGGGNWTKYCGDTEFPLLPTKEHWFDIQELFNIKIPYSDIEETYNGIHGLTNVWSDINFYTRNRSHPSEKPVEIAERCVSIFSRTGDTVFIPFAGSGNDIVACKKLERKYIASEISKKYFNSILIKIE